MRVHRHLVALSVAILGAACDGGREPQAGPVPPTSSSLPAVEEVDVQEKLGDSLCEGGAANVYRLPAPVYSGTYNRTVEGFEEIAKLRGDACRNARIVSRAPIFPSDAEGTVPTRNQLFRWAYLGDAAGLWVRVEAGSRTGWVLLDTDPVAFAPGQFADGVLAALHVEIPEPLHPSGKPDLTFTEPQALHQAGDVCIPGSPVDTSTFTLALTNEGNATSPMPLDVSITRAGFGQRLKVAPGDWLRGLEPGEEFLFVTWPAGTRLEADPEDQIAESDEGNNEVTLAPRRVLICQ